MLISFFHSACTAEGEQKNIIKFTDFNHLISDSVYDVSLKKYDDSGNKAALVIFTLTVLDFARYFLLTMKLISQTFWLIIAWLIDGQVKNLNSDLYLND